MPGAITVDGVTNMKKKKMSLNPVTPGLESQMSARVHGLQCRAIFSTRVRPEGRGEGQSLPRS